jgi:uncharacterized membrane protein (TIGR02234 family)
MTDAGGEKRRRALRSAQLLLVLAGLGLWAASRLPWVLITTADGLGQPKTTTLSGATWSTALLPVALLLVAAAVATLAVHGWALRVVAVLVAAASAGAAYPAIGQWVVPHLDVRAAELAGIPVMFLRGSELHYAGAVITLVAAVFALVGAALLMRSASGGRPATAKYAAPAVRRAATANHDPGSTGGSGASERVLWDALDEGRDPTTEAAEHPQPPEAGSSGTGEGR